MKLIGAVLITAASFLSALRLIRDRKTRLRALGDLSSSLELVQGELSLRGTPLPELLQEAAEQSGGVGQELFRGICSKLDRLGEDSFADLWKGEIQNCCGMLRPDEAERLSALGLVLGRCALDQQLQALEQCRAFFREKQAEAQRSIAVISRMLYGLCLSCGALLAILLY